ncbi:hypothetical protein KCP77_22130 [Salmonella enterica subsp. enterica]|nr:hypothetical protein KCP77_22130 [Salmonella enterica subsp. enterica]
MGVKCIRIAGDFRPCAGAPRRKAIVSPDLAPGVGFHILKSKRPARSGEPEYLRDRSSRSSYSAFGRRRSERHQQCLKLEETRLILIA